MTHRRHPANFNHITHWVSVSTKKSLPRPKNKNLKCKKKRLFWSLWSRECIAA